MSALRIALSSTILLLIAFCATQARADWGDQDYNTFPTAAAACSFRASKLQKQYGRRAKITWSLTPTPLHSSVLNAVAPNCFVTISQGSRAIPLMDPIGPTCNAGFTPDRNAESGCIPVGVASPQPAIPPATPTIRVFFSIAYLSGEKTDPPLKTLRYQSFPDAAATWERETKTQYGFREGHDIFIRAFVRSAEAFIDAWDNNIAPVGAQPNHVVVAGGVFTHASTPHVDTAIPAGLEFSSLPHVRSELMFGELGTVWYDELVSIPVASTLTPQMMMSLKTLNWDKDNGRLNLFGCNTALTRRGNPDWSPASVFATAQKVRTWGEYGFAYFSQSPTEYIAIPDAPTSSTNVYLGAYCRRLDLPLCANEIKLDSKIPARLSLP